MPAAKRFHRTRMVWMRLPHAARTKKVGRARPRSAPVHRTASGRAIPAPRRRCLIKPITTSTLLASFRRTFLAYDLHTFVRKINVDDSRWKTIRCINLEKYKAVRVIIGRDPSLGSSPSYVARNEQPLSIVQSSLVCIRRAIAAKQLS
jgi:hypothetical protein